MENENTYRQELMNKYRVIFKDLFRYIPWFEQKKGEKAFKVYSGDALPSNSISIPVYDSTLLAFVKEMQRSGLMDRNYVYVYSRLGLHTVQDEKNAIESAGLKDIEVIVGIMAKYVLGGMTKGTLWTQAEEEGIFYYSLVKIKELLDVWDQPLA